MLDTACAAARNIYAAGESARYNADNTDRSCNDDAAGNAAYDDPCHVDVHAVVHTVVATGRSVKRTNSE